MRRSLVAANWKMHGSLGFISEFADGIAKRLDVASALEVTDVVVFPPIVYLPACAALLPVPVGVQDVGTSATGAHTGEVASEMVREVGGTWAILGHSERRIDQGEKDDLVATKAAAAVRGGLLPIVCVGETQAERKAGHEIAVVDRQLEAVLDRMNVSDLASGAIAYEPVWAIGTGETATPEQAQEMHAFIRDKIAHVDQSAAASIRIVYGGSVKPDNARELFSQEDIDGGLVGGASLDARQFAAIVDAAGTV